MTGILTYGKAGAAGRTPVDLDKLIASRLLIQASSGGGKSRAIRQLLEETHGRVQHIVIDPEGEFASLREKFDYVLAAKAGGDVEANPRTAKLLCRKLMEMKASAILDLYELKLPERQLFVRNFLNEMLALPRSLWHPVLVVIDETQQFMPERGSGDAVSTEECIALAVTGRKRGFCMAAATSRISKVHKDGVAELLNKMIGRTGDVDVKRAGDELGFGKEQRVELKTLVPGEFYVYGPAISNTVTKVRTGDVKTTHPEAGAIGVVAPAAPAKIRALLAQLAELPQEAEHEARSLAELKQENATLKSSVKRLERDGITKTVEKPVVDQGATDRAVKAALREQSAAIAKLRQGLEEAMKFIVNIEAANFDVAGVSKEELQQAIATAVQKANVVIESRLASRTREIEDLKKHAGRLLSRVQTLLAQEGQPVTIDVKATKNEPYSVSVPREAPIVPRPARIVSENGANGSLAAGDLKPAEQKILNALAAFESLGLSPVTRVSAAFFAGYTENGHFNNMVGRLRTIGMISYPSGNMLALTDEGRSAADAGAHPITTLDELHAFWLTKLSPSEGKLLRALLARHPESMSRSDLAKETGYTENGHFNNMVGHLRSLGAAAYPSGNMVIATAVLFPEGLA